MIPSHAWNSAIPPPQWQTDSLNPNTARLLRVAPTAVKSRACGCCVRARRWKTT